MRMIRRLFILISVFSIAGSLSAQQHKKRLAIGEVKGFQHDSVSHALATIERLGRESGIYDTYIRTDTQLITKRRLENNAKNLDYFDAVLFYTTGELAMDDQQKKDLLAFVHDDGKGFVGVHSAVDTFYMWPAYGDMTGAYFKEHPWNIFDAPVIVEDPNFPGMQGFSREFTFRDESYQVKDFSREKGHVIAHLDAGKLDLANPRVTPEHRADKEFPVIWSKQFGKGRAYYSTFGHREETWDDPRMQKMYHAAIEWTMSATR